MRSRIVIPILLAIALTAVALFFVMRKPEPVLPAIAVTQAWARATPPGAEVGAVYITIENNGGGEDRLVGATSPAAQSAMLHETVEENGVSQMRHAVGTIAPGGRLEMRPGGAHIMLMGLAAPLTDGDTLDLTLSFENAGEVAVRATVAPVGADAPLD